MRVALSELEQFYDSPLGALVGSTITHKLIEAWGAADRLRVAGFGFVQPFLGGFTAASHCIALVPEGMGVRAGAAYPACLVRERAWPLPDASIDRLFVMHGLEEVGNTRQLLREAWRVLADDGLMILAAANRRGLWATLETTPFAAGRPYSRRQMDLLLEENMFAPTAYATALHFPPLKDPNFLRLARTWERLGATIEGWPLPRVLPNVAGLNLVEARKQMAVPISGSKSPVFRHGLLSPGAIGSAPARTKHASRKRQ